MMMRTQKRVLVAGLVLLACFTWRPCLADDLDDGIEVDDNMKQYQDIGNHPDLNFAYLSQRARSRAATGIGDAGNAKDGALNSVILEPGAQINGDIIIIDQSKGDKTIITE
jgi:hypothetical protein